MTEISHVSFTDNPWYHRILYCEYIEAWTVWVTFHWQQFKIHFLERMKFAPDGPMKNKFALVQVMFRCQNRCLAVTWTNDDGSFVTPYQVKQCRFYFCDVPRCHLRFRWLYPYADCRLASGRIHTGAVVRLSTTFCHTNFENCKWHHSMATFVYFPVYPVFHISMI